MRKAAAAARRSKAALLGVIPARFSYATGQIKTVTAGGATDGLAELEVTVNGSDVTAPYLKSYAAPTVGDVVAVLLVDGSPLILGALGGYPNF